ncbi:MAG: SDR family oxidoreductase [SAR324 cluster bacterium]|nr:SDR family oxidoreductase [SAR324 cluster bacterium]
MDKKVTVITGCNRGIGLALCQVYQESGYQVIGVCRQSSKELEELGVQVVSGIDITEASSIATLQKELQGVAIDILVNNAGLLSNETLNDLNFERIAKQFAINAMGPLRVTEALLGNLGSGSKLALITSRMGSIADNTSGSRYGYRMSKAALNAAGVSLAQDLKHQNIAVAILHPGFVKTGMTGHNGDVLPEQAAKGLYQRIEELTMANTGGFWHANGQRLEW